MKIAHLSLVFAIAAGAAGCATEMAVAPPSATTTGIRWGSARTTDVPLLYVVDGVRLPLDQVPAMEANQVLTVSVLKGRLALQKYGPDAAYGAVEITTKPRT